MQQFNDRFILSAPSLTSINLDVVTDAQLEALCPPLKRFSEQVRHYSALIRRKSTKEIYIIVTGQVDPRIALILAAARDKNGVRLFPDLQTVKEVMFGPVNETSVEYVDTENNIFVEGVRRIAASLTASILIGQLAQIEEQAKHSAILEDQALKDLQRILQVADLVEANNNNNSTLSKEEDSKSFYFESKKLDLNISSLKVEVYMPSSINAGWQSVGNYTGRFSTGQIVTDLSDTINTATLANKTSNILASPILSAEGNLHKIDFQARLRDANIQYEVISVRIQYIGDSSEELPFKWGPTLDNINYETVNSALLSVSQGKATTLSTSTSTSTGNEEPKVLYFRRSTINSSGELIDYLGNTTPKSSWAITQPFEFRISPTMSESKVVSIAYSFNSDPVQQTLLDNYRPSSIAETLINSLFEIKGSTRALGALIRNDNTTSANSLVAVELVAFSATNPETWIILDILSLPKDIECAVGNLQTPLTSFSNKPRSIRVPSKYTTNTTKSSVSNTGTGSVVPRIVKIPVSDSLRDARDRGRRR